MNDWPAIYAQSVAYAQPRYNALRILAARRWRDVPQGLTATQLRARVLAQHDVSDWHNQEQQ